MNPASLVTPPPTSPLCLRGWIWADHAPRLAVSPVSLAAAVLLILSGAFATAAAQSPNDTLEYSENFNAGGAAGWEPVPGWEFVISEGGYALRGDGLGHAHTVYRATDWPESRLRCRVRLDADFAHVSYRDGDQGRYYLSINADATFLYKHLYPDTVIDTLQTGPGISYGAWHDLDIDSASGTITVTIDGASVLTYADPDPLVTGGMSFESFDGRFWLDDIEVYVPASRAAPTDLVWVRTGGPLGGLGYDIRVSPSDAATYFVTDAYSGVFRSTDAGTSWTPVSEGITTRTGASGDAIPVFCLSFDPGDPRTLWIGTQNTRGVYKSTDGGASWVQKVNGITETTGIAFRGMTVDPNQPQTVYSAAEISSWTWAGEERRGREFDLTKGVVYKSIDGGNEWQAVWRGDSLARYVFVDPRDSNVLYISTGIFDREAANSDPAARVAGGEGVLKSTDGGVTWTRINSGLNNLFVGSLFMHPENPDILLAGTGNNQYYDNGGVYRTLDGGGSWQQTLPDLVITAVEFAISDPDIAYAGGADAIYRSEDGGTTWSKTTAANDGWGSPGVRAGFPIDFQIDPADPDRLFVNNYGGGNFFSADGGRTWSVASRGYTGAQTRDVAVDPGAPGRVYAAARSGLFLSGNGGGDWVGRNAPPASSLEWNAVAVDPSNPQHVLASNNWNALILQSSDYGLSWTAVTEATEANRGWRALAFAPSDPRTVYAGISSYLSAGVFDDRLPAGGIYVSRDGGSTWSAANDATSADANVTALSVSPTDPRVVLAATGNHGILKTTDGGTHWNAVNQGLPASPVALSLAIDPVNSQTLFTGLDLAGLYRSEDGGASWTASVSGLNPQATVSDVVFDPTAPDTMYAADRLSGVFLSRDGGTTWLRLTNGLRTRAVNALAISSEGKHLYAATEGEGVFRLDLDGAPPPTSEVIGDDGAIIDDAPVDTPPDTPVDAAPDAPTDDGGAVDAAPEPDPTSGNGAGASPRPSGGCGVGMILLTAYLPCFLLWRSRRRSTA